MSIAYWTLISSTYNVPPAGAVPISKWTTSSTAVVPPSNPVVGSARCGGQVPLTRPAVSVDAVSEAIGIKSISWNSP